MIPPKSTKEVIARIATEFSKETGVRMTEKNSVMVENRLKRRLVELGIPDFLSYWSFFEEHRETEFEKLVSLLTTHHTFFFREFLHFEFLENQLPALIAQAQADGRKDIEIWCAACSYGHEVYSLAMFLDDYLERHSVDIGFKIHGTDVDPESVKMAANGVYSWAHAKTVPNQYLSRYFLRGTKEIADFAKVHPQISQHCSFAVSNLMQSSTFPAGRSFDVIFCRNVFIYFSHDDIAQSSSMLLKHLRTHGYFIIGLSDTLADMQLPLKNLGQSVYRPLGAEDREQPVVSPPEAREEPSVAPEPLRVVPTEAPVSASPVAVVEEKIRVLCVDDSPSVLKVMEKVLLPETGFEIVGTAKDGTEIEQKIKDLQPDVLTLDIHMPNKNGIEYLRDHFHQDHPPVVMVSSVSADDADWAFKAFEYGAFDYVQKPELKNFRNCANQIRVKLRFAHNHRQQSQKSEVSAIRQAFAKHPIIADANEKLKVIVCTNSQRAKLKTVLGEMKAPQPPVAVLFENLEQLDETIVKSAMEEFADLRPAKVRDKDLFSERVYFGQVEDLKELAEKYAHREKVIMVLGEVLHTERVREFAQHSLALMVEDLGEHCTEAHRQLMAEAEIVAPYTSFTYEADQKLCQKKTRAA